MSGTFHAAAVALLALTLLYLWRVLSGPTVYDRVLGLYGIATKAIVLLVLIGALYGRLDMFLDICLGYGLMSLVGSLGAAKFLQDSGEAS